MNKLIAEEWRMTTDYRGTGTTANMDSFH